MGLYTPRELKKKNKFINSYQGFVGLGGLREPFQFPCQSANLN